MVFKKAQEEFDKQTHEAPREIEGDWEHFKRYVKTYLGTKRDEIDSYASKLNYPGNDRDKTNYVSRLGGRVKTMLKDKKATNEELVNFYNKLHQSSEKIKQILEEKQKGYELFKYRELEKSVAGDYRKANFEGIIKKLYKFQRTLSPLNTTLSSTYANIDILSGSKDVKYSFAYNFDYQNPKFKLDIIIKKRVLALLEQKQLYQKVFKKGVYIKGRKKENYIMGKDGNGNIILGDVYWNGEKEEITARSEIKINWSDLVTEIQRNKYKTQKAKVINNKGIQEAVDFKVEVDPNIKMEKDRLRNAKYLKQINYVFNSMEFIESMGLSKERKPLVMASIDETFNGMGEFFYYSKGTNQVLPHAKFDNLNDIQKVFLIKEIFIKIQQTIKRKELEKKVEEEKNPHLKSFHIAEVAIMNGDYLKAYAHARKFIRAATGHNMKMRYLPSSGTASQITRIKTPAKKTNILLKKIPREKILQAKIFMRESSAEMIKVAERYLASLKNSKVDIQQSKDTIKAIKKIMKSGKAHNLHDAFRIYEEQLKKDLKKGLPYGVYQRKYQRMQRNPLFAKRKAPTEVMERLNMLNKPYFSRANILRELTLSTETKTENGRIGYLTSLAKQTALRGLGKYSVYKPGVAKLNLPNGKGPRFSTQAWYTDERQIGSANVLFQAAMVEDVKKMRRIEQRDPQYWEDIKKHRENIIKDPELYKQAKKFARKALEKKGKYTKKEYDTAVENTKKLLIKLRIKQYEKEKILGRYIKYSKSQIVPKYDDYQNAPFFNQGNISFPKDKWKPQYLNAVKAYFGTYKTMAKEDKDWQDMENLFYNELPLTIAMLAISGGVANVFRAGIGALTRNVLARVIATEGGNV
jgi:hypothetical protein